MFNCIKEELQDMKQKLEKCKQSLRLERRKRVRSIEKTRKLASSLNGIKVESHKQKQIINKFNFLLDADVKQPPNNESLEGNVARDEEGHESRQRILSNVTFDVDDSVNSSNVDKNDSSMGLELARKLSIFGRKGLITFSSMD